MKRGVDWPCELIFFILTIQKSDLEELAEVMFQVGEWPWELLICLSDALENIGEVDEAMFQGVERPCELIFNPGHQKNTNWTKSRKWSFK
jgi:hypothetical protein